MSEKEKTESTNQAQWSDDKLFELQARVATLESVCNHLNKRIAELEKQRFQGPKKLS